MKYRSVFDIIGPVMVGPSSSHTAGAVRIGQVAGSIFGEKPKEVEIHFYGSFAQTYRGHATDVAVVAGILGFAAEDERVKDSILIAQEEGIELHFFEEEAVTEHPNTLRLVLKSQKETMEITGISTGGGAIQITELNGFALRLSGENPAILILHKDAYGTVAAVTAVLTEYEINISHMEVSRLEKGCTALMAIETDQPTGKAVLQRLSEEKNVQKIITLNV